MKAVAIGLALLLATTSASGASAAGSAAAGLQALKELNLTVLGNLTSTSEVEGKTYVGGSVGGGTSNYAIGSTSGQGAVASTRAAITVAGNVTSAINVNNAAGVAVGGNVGQLNLNAVSSTVAVGGDLGKFNSTTGTAIKVGGNASNIDLRANNTLDVGGNLSNFNGANPATVRVGGTISGNANANGASVTSNLGSGIVTVARTADYVATTKTLHDDLGALSARLGSFAADSTVNASDANNVKFVSSGGADHIAVFDITDAAAFFSATAAHAFSFDFTGADTVIINVSNATYLSSLTIGQNFLGTANLYAQKLIWNVDSSIGTINLQTGFIGSLLAVDSNLHNANFIQGSVAVANFDQNGEVHLGTYGGTGTLAMVPEPAIWAELIAGFGLAGVALRRRRGIAATA